MFNGVGKIVDVDKLIELWPSRYPTKRLEELMGNPQCTLYAKAAKIGLKPRRWYWSNGIEKVDRNELNI